MIDVYGDSELVTTQVNGSYQTKHPRMRAYINEVWHMLGNFFNEHRVMLIPRIHNKIVDYFPSTIGSFKIPIYPNRKYEIKVVNRPFIPDNSKYWQVFQEYLQIKIFLEMLDEFANTFIDGENKDMEYVEGSAVGDEDIEN